MKQDYYKYLNIPKINIVCYLLFMGILITFFTIYIWPGIIELKEKNNQIDLLRLSIKKQEKLFPFYEILLEENKRLSKYNKLAFTEIINCDSQGLMFEVEQKCKNNHVNIMDFKPIISMIDDNSEQISFSIEMEGKLTNLDKALKQIVMLSCIDYIEKIEVEKKDMEPSLITHKIILLLHGFDNDRMQKKGN